MCNKQQEMRGGRSVREDHQPGVENDGEEDMACGHEGEWEEDSPGISGNLIAQRDKAGREDKHHPKREDTEKECEAEPAHDSRDLLEKVRLFDFLLRCTPRDVIREEMCEQGLGQMD